MKLRGFITHKAAEYYSDCADFFRICPRTKRVAVSDGVSQSIMPAEWARILVDSFVNEEWAPGESTEALKERWLTQAMEFADAQRQSGKNPWMLENCLLNKEGAAATFCGVVFSDDGRWKASILGDSSLVEINEDNRILRICSSKEGAFNNRPDYFDSFDDDNGVIHRFDGILNKSSKILLVSDPFSELFQKVKGTSAEEAIINQLLAITDITDFNNRVDALRQDYQMHNDDSTIVIIEPDESNNFNILYESTLDSSIEKEKLRFEEERAERERILKLDDSLWLVAIEEDSELSYRKYIESSSLCAHRKEALKRINAILEEKAEVETWEGACSGNQIEGYQKYLVLFPNGRHTAEAKAIIAYLSDQSALSQSPEENSKPQEGPPSAEPFCERVNPGEIELSNQEGDSEVTRVFESGNEGPEVLLSTSRTEEVQSDGIDKHLETKGSFTESDSTSAEANELDGYSIQSEEINKGKVEIESESCERLSLPEDVDPSDGIDKVEFQRLQETALLLFKKYHSRFEKAFQINKWKEDRASTINQCFADFWCELERIIYLKKDNG